MLDGLALEMNRLAPAPDGGKFFIGWAYGRPRVERQYGRTTGAQDISPRLPSGQLADWIHGFLAGVRACNESNQAANRKAA